jgi:hypothetical protein
MIPHKAYVQEDYVLKKLRPEKKGTVVWPAMFFEPPEKIRPEKKSTVV